MQNAHLLTTRWVVVLPLADVRLTEKREIRTRQLGSDFSDHQQTSRNRGLFLFAKRRKQGECRIYKHIGTLRDKGW